MTKIVTLLHFGQICTVINIIKIKELASHFARCGLIDRSVAIQILTLLMWQNFNTKRGTQQKNKKKRSVWKFFNFDNIDDRIDLSDLVLNFVILNNLNNNRLSSIQ
jgi:hypothetical protein